MFISQLPEEMKQLVEFLLTFGHESHWSLTDLASSRWPSPCSPCAEDRREARRRHGRSQRRDAARDDACC